MGEVFDIASHQKSIEILTSLLKLISATETPQRQQYMVEACKLAGQDGSQAFLWLHDESKNRVNLDRMYPIVDDRIYSRRFAYFTESSPIAETPAQQPIDWPIRVEPDLEEILNSGQSLFLPLLWRDIDPKLLGYLHLVTSRPIQEDLRSALMILADALTTAIHRSRQKRRLEALDRIGSTINLQTTKAQLYKDAAEAIKEIIQAKACVIYQHEKNLGVQAVASTLDGVSPELLRAGPESIISTILNGNHALVRLDNLHDENERAGVFGTEVMDNSLAETIESPGGICEKQRGWMAAPVMIKNHAVAVINLYNKTRHLSEGFSKTDAEILQRVCKFLSDVIPGIETLQAMRAISERISPGALKTKEQRSSLFNLLSELIAGVASAAVIQTNKGTAEKEHRFFGGEDWMLKTGHQRQGDRPKEVDKDIHLQSGGRWTIDFDIPIASDPNSENSSANGILRIGLKRGYLSEYETEIIRFFCAELGQELRLEASLAKELNHLLEVRHAIRSGLEGLNYIQSALAIFNRFQETGNLSELHRARFHKALNRAYTFYKKTRILLEESRFLVADITRDQLRPGAHSIKELIREVCICLQPEADKRGVVIDPLQSKLPYSMSDNFPFDRGWLEIAIFNLVDNAIKYSFREKSVRIKLELDKDDKDYWSLSVENIGVHIPEGDINDIFKEFVRKQSGLGGTARPGTGLGLPVVEKIVRAHGGMRPMVSSELLGFRQDSPARTVFTLKIPRKLPTTDSNHA